jgi:Fe-S oxidoreductase
VHSIEFFWELLTTGKIKIPEKFKDPIALHYPCNTMRGYGLMDKLHEVVHMICENVVDMSPSREHELCCSAGGGIINCGPPFKVVRVTGNKAKADQLAATGVKYLVAPCHNCHGGLDDIINNYKLNMHTKFLGDLIYPLMAKTRAA